MNTTLSKKDIRNSVIIGEMIALFSLAILKNLEHEIQGLDVIVRFNWLMLIIFPVLINLWVYITYYFASGRVSFFQFAKFLVVGLSNVSIDFGILNLLILFTNVKSGIFFAIIKAVSFLAAIMNSYLWNKFWVFESNEARGIGKQFFKFFNITFVGLVINVTVASIIVNLIKPFGDISPTIWANIGALIAIFFPVIWNFLGYKYIVFK